MIAGLLCSRQRVFRGKVVIEQAPDFGAATGAAATKVEVNILS